MSRYRRRRENFGDLPVCPANQLDGKCSGSEPVKGSCSDYYEWYQTVWGGYQWQKCKETDGDTACESYDPVDDQSGVCQYACGAGTWNTDGTPNCDGCFSSGWPCPDCNVDPGYYCPVASTTDAGVECPIGTYSSSTGAVAECTDCGAGTYMSGTGATSCQNCPVGTYMSSEGATSCTDCPAGTYSSSTGATSEDTCTNCPAGTYRSSTGGTSVDTCTTCGTGTYSAEGATSCSDITNIDCEFRGNSWHIINNSDNTLCGPYSYKTEEACKNAWTTQLINPLTDPVCETPMINTPNTILPGAYVGIIAQAACAGTTAPTCKPATNVRYQRTRYAPELEAGAGGVITEGNVDLGCGESNGTSTGTCFDFSALLPSMYIAGQGNPLPIFHDDDGNLNYSGKFVENGTNDWNLENLADGSKTGILWTQGCRNCTNSDPTWTKQIFTDDEDGFNAAATAAATEDGTTGPTSPLYWPWNDANLDTSQKDDGHFAYYTGENCSAGVNCHGWYKDPLYYGSPNRGSGYNLDGLWGNAMVAYDKDSDSGYLTPSQACSSHCK